MNKIEIAKDILRDLTSDLEMGNKFLEEASNKFIGKALQNEIERWTEDVQRNEVKIEALKNYIKEQEMLNKQEADMAKEEEAEQERLADNALEHQQEMLAEENNN